MSEKLAFHKYIKDLDFETIKMLKQEHKERGNIKEIETRLSMTQIDEQKMETIEPKVNSDPDPSPSDSSDSSSSSYLARKIKKSENKKKRRKHRKDDSSDPSSSDDSDDSDSSEDSHYRRRRRKNNKHRKKDPIRLCARNFNSKISDDSI